MAGANDSVRFYNSDEILVSVGPVICETGFGEDEFVRIEQDSDDTEDVVGVDGEVVVSRTNDRRATVTIILMQTSIANDGLTTLSNFVRTAPGMVGGVGPFIVKDLIGRALYTAQNSWVAKPPNVSFAKKATPREWKVRVANLVRNDGGS